MNNKIKAKFNKFFTLFFLLVFLNQCGMGADARKYPPEPEKRVQKNMYILCVFLKIWGF